MWRLLNLVLLPVALATTGFAAGPDEAAVKGVIQQFQQAIERRDVGAIETLVSPDVVVLENGHRNDGWKDFRDNHLVPEFKEPAAPSTWEFVKVVAGSEMAWGYTKQTIDVAGKDGKNAGYLVWSAYVLQKTGPTWKVALLDWSVRRLGSAD
ncbi:MAG: nuclear transport factor 2 family protein [Acidobacteria bacterium]|jgi:ketosteroid isomerase-like protein|nr:nuclear transport factor 2 family protein [Acidobacteriota bacterium]